MGKHTPGPWEAWDWGKDGKVGVGKAYGNESDICSMSNDTSRTFSEDIANARLISAAPDLLEALEELLSIGSVFISAIEANDPSVDFENWEAKARTAIARARGEA